MQLLGMGDLHRRQGIGNNRRHPQLSSPSGTFQRVSQDADNVILPAFIRCMNTFNNKYQPAFADLHLDKCNIQRV